MSRTLPPKIRTAVVHEIRMWQTESLIPKSLADVLVARYPESNDRGLQITILMILGAVLIGLGTILFFAANWQSIAPAFKIGLIVAAVGAAHYAGFYFKYEPGERPKLGSALILLGNLFFGSGIWLVSQVFNFDLAISDGLLIWALGAVAVAAATRLPSTGILATILTAAWPLSLSSNFHYNPQSPNFIIFAASLALSLIVSYAVKSRVSAAFALAGATLWIAFVSGASLPGMAVWGLTLFALFIYHKERWPLFTAPYMYASAVVLLGTLLSLTYTTHGGFAVRAPESLAGLVVISLGALGAALVSTRQYRLEIAFAVSAVISACLMGVPGPVGVQVILGNILFVTTLVGAAYSATTRLKSVGLLNSTIVFFCIYILCRYCDAFFSSLDRAFFFILGGIIFLLVGSIAEKGRRQIIKGMAA